MTRRQQGQGTDLEDSAPIPNSLGMPVLPQKCDQHTPEIRISSTPQDA